MRAGFAWSTSETSRVTERVAVARGHIAIGEPALQAIRDGRVAKGDPLQAARLAGVMAAKKTADLVPLCHPLMLSQVAVDLQALDDGYRIEARVRTAGRTGVEMEALTAVSVAALTIYDMVKAIDKRMVIGSIRLVKKTGGPVGRLQRRLTASRLRKPGAASPGPAKQP